MLGFSLGQLDQSIMNLSILVALITIGISTYDINYSHILNEKLSRFLDFFDGNLNCEESYKKKSYDIILLGYHRIGFKLLETLKKLNKSFVVVDYNPKVILSLQKGKVDAIYGDAGNKNFLNELPFEKAKLAVSTITDEHTNMLIKETLEETNSKAAFLATAEQPRTALDLYRVGVDYVVIPHHLGGDYASHLIKEAGINKEKYDEIGKKHKRELEKSKNNSTFNN